MFLGERYYVTFALCDYVVKNPSVCLSSVTWLHPTQRFELFGNIFAPSNSLGTRTFCVKIFKKNSKRV